MSQKNDPYYGALLVEKARLHLGTVMAGQDSEPFFMAMLQIAEAGIYLEYTTLKDKRVKFKGIKDFIHSVYYGLGVRNMNDFVLNSVKSAMKERSKNRYAYKFIDWLKEQDSCFCFPEEFFEFRRVMRFVAFSKRKSKQQRLFDFKTTRFLYEVAPHLMKEIGDDRKYKSVQDCFYKEGYAEKKKNLTPIKLFSEPTSFQIEEIGETLFKRFGTTKSRCLALKLLQLCSDARSSGSGDSRPDSDDLPAGAEWI